jgi:ABC-type spermidine/putrescine transport system permease subunit II
MTRVLRLIDALAIFSWGVIAFLVLPLIAILPMSFSSSSLLRLPPPGYSLRWYEAYLFNNGWMNATLNSIIVGSVTAVLSVILGTATAYGLARSSWKGKALLQALILSPLLIPVIVIAVATYSVFSLVGLNGTFAGLIIGHTVITFPYTVVVGFGRAGALRPAPRTDGRQPRRDANESVHIGDVPDHTSEHYRRAVVLVPELIRRSGDGHVPRRS